MTLAQILWLDRWMFLPYATSLHLSKHVKSAIIPRKAGCIFKTLKPGPVLFIAQCCHANLTQMQPAAYLLLNAAAVELDVGSSENVNNDTTTCPHPPPIQFHTWPFVPIAINVVLVHCWQNWDYSFTSTIPNGCEDMLLLPWFPFFSCRLFRCSMVMNSVTPPSIL